MKGGNLNDRRSVEAAPAVDGAEITAGRVHEIAPKGLRQYVNPEQPDAFKSREGALRPGPVPKWRFPAG